MARKDFEKTMIKAGEAIYASDKPVTMKDLEDFLGGLSGTLNEIIKSGVDGEFAKASMTGIGEYLSGLAKLSDKELDSWIRRGSTTSQVKEFPHEPSLDFDRRMGQPQDPDKGWGTSPPPRQDNQENYVPTATGNTPGSSIGQVLRGRPESASVVSSSYPAPGMLKSVTAFLDKMSNATPADMERARTGLSNLDSAPVQKMDDPEFETAFTKALGDPEFRAAIVEALGLGGDVQTEIDLFYGKINSETELRKGIVLNGVSLLERVAKLRDADLAKRVHLVGDLEDDWETKARQGRG